MEAKEKEKEKLKKFGVYSIIVVVGIILIWLILRPSQTERIGNIDGLNKEVPNAEDLSTPHKEEAYLDANNNNTLLDEGWMADIPTVPSRNDNGANRHTDLEHPPRLDDIPRHDNFENDLQKKQKELDDANSRIEALLQKQDVVASNEDNNSTISEYQRQQMERLEETRRQVLEMMNRQTGGSGSEKGRDDVSQKRETMEAMPIKEEGVQGNISTMRKGNFYGTINNQPQRQTISASVFGEYTVSTGQQIRMRLEEPMRINNMIIGSGNLITGTVHIAVDRVLVSITSVENGGIIMPVNMEVYDIDGQLGIYVPGSLENEALREISSDITNSIGNSAQQATSTYINNQNAIEQAKSDILRGTIAGVTRYASKKLSEIKVTIQDGSKVYLMQKKQ